MATTTRSEKLKSIITLTIILAVIYTVIVLIASLFIMAWSWGENTNFLQKSIIFLFSRPFKTDLTIWAIPLNGLFWGGIVAVVKYFLSKKK
jgi:H+/Cl- antiporter ClcA